jgi:hypothetical protein
VVVVRFGTGTLQGGTGEIAISIRVGRVRGRGTASGRLLVEFLVGLLAEFHELRQRG